MKNDEPLSLPTIPPASPNQKRDDQVDQASARVNSAE